MTEMKIEDNVFYTLKAGDDKYIYSEKKEAINKLKEYLKELDTDDVSVFEVDASEENWRIKEIGWKEIVKDLI